MSRAKPTRRAPLKRTKVIPDQESPDVAQAQQVDNSTATPVPPCPAGGSTGVYLDRNRKSAIVYKVGTSYMHLVLLDEGMLTTSRMHDEEFFEDRGFVQRPLYPVTRAVEKFRQHNGGISEAADRALAGLILSELP